VITVKRLDKIIVKHVMDEDGNFDYLGEFSDTQEGDFSVIHSDNPRHYKYFNADNVENMDQAMENYKRACIHGDSWHYIGVKVVAVVSVSDDGVFWASKEIESNGLYGTESDSDTEYLKEVAKQELDAIEDELKGLGISIADIAKQWELSEVIKEY